MRKNNYMFNEIYSLTREEKSLFPRLTKLIIDASPFFITRAILRKYGFDKKDIEFIFKGQVEEAFILYALVYITYNASEKHDLAEKLHNCILEDVKNNKYELSWFNYVNEYFVTLDILRTYQVFSDEESLSRLITAIVRETVSYNPINVSRETLSEWFGKDDELYGWFRKGFYDTNFVPYPIVFNRLYEQNKVQDIIRIFAKLEIEFNKINSKEYWNLFNSAKLEVANYDKIHSLYISDKFNKENKADENVACVLSGSDTKQ